MATASATFSPARSKASAAILRGGLLAGALDITAACITNASRVTPQRVLQSVASGLLGAASFRGGWKTAALGLFLHFVIALGAAAVYYAASRKLPALRQQPLIWGPLFGVAVYGFMNLIVLPLSAIPFKPSYALSPLVIGLLVHMFCIGLPIALVIRRYAK